MKKLSALILLLALFAVAGCSKDVSTETQTESDAEDTAVEEISYSSPDKETLAASGSSVLEDDTGYGFGYEIENVFDLDYSTSWCPEDEESPELTIVFQEPTELGKVGIVPGFARDEEIFMQNNRLKTVEVFYDDEPVGELEFDDYYGMQFFDMPEGPVETLVLKITDVYSGSKYDDTCIAELDFWSEWVATEDSDAAYNYYLEYKEAYSLRPVGLASFDFTVEQAVNSCGDILDSYLTIEKQSMGNVAYFRASDDEWLYSHDQMHEDWYFNIYGDIQIAVSAQMNEWAEVGDEVEIRWLAERGLMPNEEGYPKLLESDTAEVKECSDGSLYIYDLFDPGVGSYSAAIYYDGKLIGKDYFGIAQ